MQTATDSTAPVQANVRTTDRILVNLAKDLPMNASLHILRLERDASDLMAISFSGYQIPRCGPGATRAPTGRYSGVTMALNSRLLAGISAVSAPDLAVK